MRKVINMKLSLLITMSFIIITGCSSSNSGENGLDTFKQAVEDNDAEKLYETVNTDDSVHWSAKHAQDVIDNYNRTENNYNMQIEEFEEQLVAIENDQPIDNEKNKFYFDEDEEIHVRGYEYYISNIGIEDAEEITINVQDIDEEFVLEGPFDEEKIVIGKFGPGDYTFEATAEYGNDEVTDSRTVEMNSADYQRFEKQVNLGIGN